MKSFVSELLDSFDVDSGVVRVATLRYSGTKIYGMHIVHFLDSYNTKAEIQKVIKEMPYAGGYTATGRLA